MSTAWAGLNEAQVRDIGLRFVLDSLSPDSPFGAEAVRACAPFARFDFARLDDALYNVRQAVAHAEDDHFGVIRRLLPRFKNIRNTVKKCAESALHEVELFEMKNFLITFEKLREAYLLLDTKTRFRLSPFIDMTEPLCMLDPTGRRLSPFTLDETLYPPLLSIRREKIRLEGLLRTETDKSARERLKLDRLGIVAQEEAMENEAKKSLSAAMRPFLLAFEHNMNQIGELDFTLQKALLAKSTHAVCPAVSNGGALVLENMTNPAIADILAQAQKAFTPLTLTLSSGVTMLTGANMGGKSVAMKTAVLNITLGQMGFFVFAEKCQMPLFDGVCFISEDLQSVRRGLSSFGAEIVQINDIVQRAKQSFLFIAMDEPARGTNPKEGTAIVKAVAKHLHQSGCICLISTHYDIKTTDFMHYQVAGLSQTDFAALQRQITQAANGIDTIAALMDYRLIRVESHCIPPRDALNICKLLSLDEAILHEIESELSG